MNQLIVTNHGSVLAHSPSEPRTYGTAVSMAAEAGNRYVRAVQPVPMAIAAVLLVVACETDRVPAATADFPVQFDVVNDLIAPVTISIDGAPTLGLLGGRSANLTVSSRSQWLTWRSAKPLDADGMIIPDDIGEISIAIGGIHRALDITNVIQDRVYVTARIVNNTTASVSIAVFDGVSVTCVSKLPASSVNARVFTQTGYYRLQPSTELRGYRDPANCTGPYVVWPNARLRQFEPKSGFLLLTLDAAP